MVPNFRVEINDRGTASFEDYVGLCRFLKIRKSTKRITKKRFKKKMIELLKKYIKDTVK